MNMVARLALVISVLGALATWLFLEPLAAFGLQIWAAFIMWGCFYHCGGGPSGLKAALAGGVWGATMAASRPKPGTKKTKIRVTTNPVASERPGVGS